MTEQQNAFIDQMFLEMYQNLFEYAYAQFSDEFLAEEAVQESFRIACQKPEDLCKSPNPKGWLKNVLKNVISNMKRSQSTAKRILSDYYSLLWDTLSEDEASISIELLYSDIEKLDEFQLVKSMVLDGKTYADLSREWGVSVPTCRKRMQRAREHLQKKIKE